MNAAWHAKNPLGRSRSMEVRIDWHLAHAKTCGCRDIPKGVLLVMAARGIPKPSRKTPAPRRRKSPRSAGGKGRRGVTWEELKKMALLHTGAEEGLSYGTPAVYAGKKLVLRLKEDGSSVVLGVAFADRDVLLEIDPEAYYLTDHYRPYEWVLVRLERARAEQLRELLSEAFRRAGKKA